MIPFLKKNKDGKKPPKPTVPRTAQESMRELNRRGKTPDPEHYEVTYYADLPAMWQDVPNNEVLEELFQMFNLSRPQDFEGHSLSVSDVIALKRNGEVSVHYVDSIGFKDLQGFLDKQPERPSVLMPSKTEEYLALAQRTANGLTRYWESWTDYLTTASRLYKYSFADQLMIYAQRPDATACADFDIWNNRMNRYVPRSATPSSAGK